MALLVPATFVALERRGLGGGLELACGLSVAIKRTWVAAGLISEIFWSGKIATAHWPQIRQLRGAFRSGQKASSELVGKIKRNKETLLRFGWGIQPNVGPLSCPKEEWNE